MSEGKRSKVWDYFTKDPSGTVLCNLCAGLPVSQGSAKACQKNTTNLWCHLKLHHKEIHNEAYKEAHPGKAHEQQLFERTTKWTATDPRTRELDRILMEIMATDIQPYALVEVSGFKRLMQKIELSNDLLLYKRRLASLHTRSYSLVQPGGTPADAGVEESQYSLLKRSWAFYLSDSRLVGCSVQFSGDPDPSGGDHTLEWSKADSSASCIIPCAAVLRRLLEECGPTTRGIQTLRNTMRKSLDKRFSKMEECKEVVLACLLDPHLTQHLSSQRN
ncbi:hypothetical protein SKAU_G00326610 [Synaphobranchus kaupii]|uniref:BED-type domain-containing protein n=1 Tax=Synaphobranchus kaupii TaxID=118154 RepID=A0A9Q1II69_SYNKA|nr:hypothetical protein SKAU_G00326610 [Synaphobranchus kaupii]